MTKKEKKEIAINTKLLSIVDRYLVDRECLREMHSSVVPFLQEKDKERKEIVSQVLDKAMVEESKDTDIEAKEQEEHKNDDEPSKKTVSLKLSGAEVEVLMSNMGKIRRAEELFEKQVAVTLVSRFDEFLSGFLSLVLEQNPSWLISSEKTITYKELIDLKSIDKAIEGVIQKEVENLLRGSHEDQISYIDEKLKLGISDNFEKLSEFLEVAERRNLFVHTGGVVSQQYLDKCNGFGCKIKDSKQGDCLCSDSDYFNDAFFIYFEIGLRIGQAAYRRLFPNEFEVADRSLNRSAIKFMNAGEYNLAEIITEFDLAIPDKLRSKDTEYLYFARINRAFAQKFSGKDFEKGLEGVPWNVFHPKYALCLHVLRDEFVEAAKLMQSDEIKSSVGQEGFRTWPVFREFREKEEFRNVYKELYGDDYIPDLEKDTELKVEQESKALSEQSYRDRDAHR